MPPIGKYNPGQKLLFFVMVGTMVLLLLTGLVIWRSVVGVGDPVCRSGSIDVSVLTACVQPRSC